MAAASVPGVRLVRRIAEVDAAAWDRLAEDDVYARHGWLATVEETATDGADPVYFLLENDGRLEGAAIGYRLSGTAPSSLDELLLGRFARPFGRLGISLRPALLCAPLLGQGRHVLWRRDDPSPERVLETLLDAVGRHAAAERLSLAIAKLPVEERVLLDALAGRGFARTMNWPVSVLDLRWESFDAWLESLGSVASNKIRRESAAPARAGVRVNAEPDFAHLGEALFALVAANQRAYSRQPLGLESGFFRALARQHAGGCIVTVARAGTELAGTALLLTAGRAAGGPLIGVSGNPRNRRAFTYFNLAFYEPIRWCIEHGVQRLWLGSGLYDMKRRRGCRELELTMLIRHRSALGRIAVRIWCAAHRRWGTKKLERQGVRLAATSTHR